MKTDIYTQITDKIIAMLEQGVRPWNRPWEVSGMGAHPLRANGARYKGINTVMLWYAMQEQGYTSPYFITYKQALAEGGHVRKGEKGHTVVYASKFTKDAGTDAEKTIPFLKGYTVFNVAQCDGLPEKFFPKAVERTPVEKIAHAEAFFARHNANIKIGGDAAFFVPSQDYIAIPAIEAFHSPEQYYNVLAHEFGHWTGHASRLNRSFDSRGFGSEGYAKEELVAELCAAFVAAHLGLSPEPREDHASYIASWLKALRNDKRFIVSAASHATKAMEYLTGGSEPEPEEAAE